MPATATEDLEPDDAERDADGGNGPLPAPDPLEALHTALARIERRHGKGKVMRGSDLRQDGHASRA